MIGQTISHYEILEKLGEGGMGVVYKARDLTLDRPVALKFLPHHLAATEQDKARFVQEAKAASAINHPNICTIYAVEEHDGALFIAMEFIEGRTLRQRLSGEGPAPAPTTREAVEIGAQIAEGLAAAHEKGIIHRDVKPENIMIRKDGIVQIMDFGLAKLRGVSRLTKEGSTVGTAGYMSPEQVQGHDADHRSDIFSLGVVLYEMLCSQLPFKGMHETAVAYEIVNVDPPPVSAVKPETDPELDRIVADCLEKNANERTQSAKQVAIDLRRARRESGRQRVSRISAAHPVAQSQTQAASAPPPSRPAWIPWAVSGLLLAALAATTWLYLRERSRDVPAFAASLLPPERAQFLLLNGGHLAVSPDGSMLAFVTQDSSGGTSLWIRDIATGTMRRLQETGGAEYPFWSPDSRFIGFFVPGKLKKILASGGPPTVICDAPSGRGGSWGADDLILFAPRFDRSPISRVKASGGDVATVTRLDTAANMSNHRWPHLLPDGKHFMYTTQAKRRSTGFDGEVYAASLDGSVNTLLMKVSTNTEYRDGHLIYSRDGALLAQPFDPDKLAFTGEAVPLLDKVSFARNRSKGVFTTAPGGLLIHLQGGGFQRKLAWCDLEGGRLMPVDLPYVSNNARLDRDGTRFIFDTVDPVAKNEAIWMYDIRRALATRLTFGQDDDSNPVLSPDGDRVVFTRWADRNDLQMTSTSGSGSVLPLGVSINTPQATDWSRDGKYILYQDVDSSASFDIWVASLEEKGRKQPLLATGYREEAACFSPDGRWIAYVCDESGRQEVYVRPFPSGEGKWQVSQSGGDQPVWERDGRGIYYSNDDGVLHARVDGSRGSFVVGESKPVARHPAQGALDIYDVTPDGKRLLVSYLPQGGNENTLTVMTDWRRQLLGK